MTRPCHPFGHRLLLLVPGALLFLASAFSLHSQAITNLEELTRRMSLQEREHQDVELEVTVCAASRPTVGVMIVEDDSGVELLEVGDWGRAIRPGERIRIQGHDCLLRKRETGIEISAAPVVNNDGTHRQQTITGEVSLTAGLTPLRLDWFNCLGPFNLGVSYSTSNRLAQSIESSNLWHVAVDALGRTNLLPGLRAECYEDYWIAVPDFDLLRPVKTGVATNFDLEFRTCDEMVGIRYTGFFKAPCSGQY